MRRCRHQLPSLLIVCAPVAAALAMATAPAVRAAEPPAANLPSAVTRPAAYTYHDLYRESVEFNRRTLVEPYQRIGRHDPKWDKDAAEFLELIGQQASARDVPPFYRPPDDKATVERIKALSKSLLGSGCNDPLVLYACAATLPLENAADRTRAAGVLRRAVGELRNSKYPKPRVLAAMINLARITDDRAEAAKLVADAYAQLPDVCRRTFSGIDRRTRLGYVASQLQNRNQQRAFVDALGKLPDADPWIRDVVTARLHIALAWDSRGNGAANTVTEEGWKGFHSNLERVRDALTRAWKLAPELPEAPSDMIGVAMGGGKKLGEDKLDWFDRALKAQIDYQPAYTAMLQASLPRWGGNYDEMMKLAEACVQKPRFDTLVPWQYVLVVRTIGEDVGKPWVPLGKPEVFEQFVKVAEGYAEHFGSPRSDHYKSLHIAAALWRQRFPEARKALDDLIAAGGKPDPDAFTFLGADDPSWTIGSIYANTGPHAADIKEAFELAKNSETRKHAITKLRALQAKLAKDDPSAPFFSGTIAVIDAALKLEAGEWSPLVRTPTLRDWLITEGEWSIDARGAITGWNRSGGPKTLLWRGRTIGRDPGRVFEVSGTVEFVGADKAGGDGRSPETTEPATKPAQKPPESSASASAVPPAEPTSPSTNSSGPTTVPTTAVQLNHTAGLAVAQVSSRRRGFAVVNVGGQNAGFAFGTDQVAYPAKVKNGCEFLVKVDDHTLTLFVDGKQVGQPYSLGESFAGEIAVGIGGAEGSVVRFTKLRVRKLGVQTEEKGAKE